MCISHLLSRKRARVNFFQNYKSKHNQVAIHGVLQFNKLQQHQWLGHLLHMELLPFLCNAGMVSLLCFCVNIILLCVSYSPPQSSFLKYAILCTQQSQKMHFLSILCLVQNYCYFVCFRAQENQVSLALKPWFSHTCFTELQS